MLAAIGAKTTADLPARIAASVQEQENRGEILVKIIQLVIALLWVALFLFSPTPPDDRLVIVPYAIAGYTLFTAVGLMWAVRRRLPSWAIYISIIVDMGLLYAVVWSTHVQYNQPPAFDLKAPMIIFLFVFIALRALRFDPRFVIFSGLTAALGWLLLLVNVLVDKQGVAWLTEDYVTYLTTDAIMVSAEINKIVTILAVTLILAIAIGRARTMLIQATSESAAARSLSRFFDESVADSIRTGETIVTAGEGTSRDAAILNVDVRGFSVLTQGMAPNDVIRMLAAYQRRVVPIIQANGGIIDKFMGDGIMATFGAVRPTATFAADALRAMEAVLADVAHWDEDMRLRSLTASGIGLSVAAGHIVFGGVGDQERLELTVVGSIVNLSAKLEKANRAFGSPAIATRETLQLARLQGFVPAAPIEERESPIDGIAGKVGVAIWPPAVGSLPRR